AIAPRDPAMCRTASNSPAIARTAPNENVNVAYATLNAPSSLGPTVLATSTESRKLVALESSWSARPHPNRHTMPAGTGGDATGGFSSVIGAGGGFSRLSKNPGRGEADRPGGG